jgi:hypothetical protein
MEPSCKPIRPSMQEDMLLPGQGNFFTDGGDIPIPEMPDTRLAGASYGTVIVPTAAIPDRECQDIRCWIIAITLGPARLTKLPIDISHDCGHDQDPAYPLSHGYLTQLP